MNNENKNTGALAIALVLCLIVLVILAICVYEKFTSTPAITPDVPDDTEYATVPNLNGMTLADAKAVLDNAEIVYEIVQTDSELYNEVLEVEYEGKAEGEISSLSLELLLSSTQTRLIRARSSISHLMTGPLQATRLKFLIHSTNTVQRQAFSCSVTV